MPNHFLIDVHQKLSVITSYLIPNHFPNKNKSKIKCNYILFNSNHVPNVNTSKIKCYLTSNCFPINIHQKLSVITSYLIHNHFLNENISKINCNYVLFDSNYFPK